MEYHLQQMAFSHMHSAGMIEKPLCVRFLKSSGAVVNTLLIACFQLPAANMKKRINSVPGAHQRLGGSTNLFNSHKGIPQPNLIAWNPWKGLWATDCVTLLR